MSARLKLTNLSAFADRGIEVPGYDPDQIGIGIVHLGIGAFHRAHQALYTDEVMSAQGGDWGVCGVSLRRPEVANQLSPQDCLYSSVEKHNETWRRRIVGAVREILVAPEDPSAVIDRLQLAEVRVVTLTVTENGYCLGADGELDEGHPDIVRDLADPHRPVSALGFLVAGMRARRETHGEGLTVISCDNLSRNGKKLAAAVGVLARRFDPELADWIDANCTFPDTMVDKIVPATTEMDFMDAERELGVADQGVVVGEAFRQWIIEDNFAGPVPAWNRVGAEFVGDVQSYELLKLRLLNASHSAIAYLGCLGGYETVADFMAQPSLRSYVAKLMSEEIAPTLHVPAGFDVAVYQESLLQRFSNSALRHRTHQIAMDGSQKLPHRIVPTIERCQQDQLPCQRLYLALAAWCLYVRKENIEDPMAAKFIAIRDKHGADWEAWLFELLREANFFGQDSRELSATSKELLSLVKSLDERGVLATIADELLD